MEEDGGGGGVGGGGGGGGREPAEKCVGNVVEGEGRSGRAEEKRISGLRVRLTSRF
jgi:hypothetical protein